jgi:hypothetical protein
MLQLIQGVVSHSTHKQESSILFNFGTKMIRAEVCKALLFAELSGL